MSSETHTGGPSPQEIEQQMLVERRKEIHGKSLEVIRDVVDNLDELMVRRVLVEDRVRRSPEHQQRLVPGASDIPGGWRDVKVQEGTKFMRMTFVRPRDPATNPDGHIEVEFADKNLKNGKVEPSVIVSHVRIAVDEQNDLHVLGTSNGFKFNTDYPNKNTMYNDFPVANQLLDNALIGVNDLLTHGPAAPAQPAQ
jgi:hypothetical protein